MTSKNLRDIARGALSGYWALSLAVTVVASMLGGGATGGSSASITNTISNTDSSLTEDFFAGITQEPALLIIALMVIGAVLIFGLVMFVISGATTLGLRQYYINIITKAERPDFKILFSRFKYLGKAFLLNLLITIFVSLWSFLVFLPVGILSFFIIWSNAVMFYSASGATIAIMIIIGLLIMLVVAFVIALITSRYAMAFYVMTENPQQITAMEAIRISKEMMKGNIWRLFFLRLSFFGWHCLAILSCGIGYLWLSPYILATEAAFYLELRGGIPAQGYGWNNMQYMNGQANMSYGQPNMPYYGQGAPYYPQQPQQQPYYPNDPNMQGGFTQPPPSHPTINNENNRPPYQGM